MGESGSGMSHTVSSTRLRLAENACTEPLQGELQGGGGGGLSRKADPLRYLAQIHLWFRFALAFGRVSAGSL